MYYGLPFLTPKELKYFVWLSYSVVIAGLMTMLAVACDVPWPGPARAGFEKVGGCVCSLFLIYRCDSRRSLLVSTPRLAYCPF